MSLLTDHELGVVKMIPLSAHLAVDAIASLFLAASPFIFSFNTFDANVWMPHVIAGLGYFAVSMFTESKAYTTVRGSYAHR